MRVNIAKLFDLFVLKIFIDIVMVIADIFCSNVMAHLMKIHRCKKKDVILFCNKTSNKTFAYPVAQLKFSQACQYLMK